MGRVAREHLARAADALTAARFVAAVAVVPLLASGRLSLVALLVSLSWLSDLVDGRLARASGHVTRLGPFDLTADTIFGGAIVVGLMAAGHLPLLIGTGSIIVFGGLFITGNVAASMILQLTGYIPLLNVLWGEKPAIWWLPYAAAGFAAAIDWRRLVSTNVPAFLDGVLGPLVKGRVASRRPGKHHLN